LRFVCKLYWMDHRLNARSRVCVCVCVCVCARACVCVYENTDLKMKKWGFSFYSYGRSQQLMERSIMAIDGKVDHGNWWKGRSWQLMERSIMAIESKPRMRDSDVRWASGLFLLINLTTWSGKGFLPLSSLTSTGKNLWLNITSLVTSAVLVSSFLAAKSGKCSLRIGWLKMLK